MAKRRKKDEETVMLEGGATFLSAEDRMKKLRQRRKKQRALQLEIDSATACVKELKEQLANEIANMYLDIDDEPQGELGYRDGEPAASAEEAASDPG